jgi:hypothetical protein
MVHIPALYPTTPKVSPRTAVAGRAKVTKEAPLSTRYILPATRVFVEEVTSTQVKPELEAEKVIVFVPPVIVIPEPSKRVIFPEEGRTGVVPFGTVNWTTSPEAEAKRAQSATLPGLESKI